LTDQQVYDPGDSERERLLHQVRHLQKQLDETTEALSLMKEVAAQAQRERDEARTRIALFEKWAPTPVHINALPEPIRRFVMELETNADPAGTMAEVSLARDVIAAQQIQIGELHSALAASEEKARESRGVIETLLSWVKQYQGEACDGECVGDDHGEICRDLTGAMNFANRILSPSPSAGPATEANEIPRDRFVRDVAFPRLPVDPFCARCGKYESKHYGPEKFCFSDCTGPHPRAGCECNACESRRRTLAPAPASEEPNDAPEPIGTCQCGAPIYTRVGFCGRCGR
jgi:hypothetical protein